VIVSANIGCINHLQGGTKTPVRHWIEVIDTALAARPRKPEIDLDTALVHN